MKKFVLLSGLVLLSNFNIVQAQDEDSIGVEQEQSVNAFRNPGRFRPSSGPYNPKPQRENVTDQLPVIETKLEGFTKVPDVAQYGHADWSGVVGIAHHITLEQAAKIANENVEINFFFYMTGVQMVLNTDEDGTAYRVFRQGDAVFFSGEPHWGSAKGFSDGYIKE